MAGNARSRGRAAILGLLLVVPALLGDECRTDKAFFETALPGLQSALNSLSSGLIAGLFAALRADDAQQPPGDQEASGTATARAGSPSTGRCISQAACGTTGGAKGSEATTQGRRKWPL